MTTSILGAAVLVPQGVQQLFAVHADRTPCRATGESLRREALPDSAGAAPYADSVRRGLVLAERLVGITTGVNHDWVSAQRTARDAAARSLGGPGEAP